MQSHNSVYVSDNWIMFQSTHHTMIFLDSANLPKYMSGAQKPQTTGWEYCADNNIWIALQDKPMCICVYICRHACISVYDGGEAVSTEDSVVDDC